MKVILGSSSRWRQSLMIASGIPHSVMVADIDEKAVTYPGCIDRLKADPQLLTVAISEAKADAIMTAIDAMGDSFGDVSLLITSDQVVSYKGSIREKPIDNNEAKSYLQSYATEPATTVTAVTVTVIGGPKHGTRVTKVEVASQSFHLIPDDVIDQVIAKGDIFYCCGGFMIDEPLLQPYLGTRVGTEDSIMGLPILLLQSMLQSFGWQSQ